MRRCFPKYNRYPGKRINILVNPICLPKPTGFMTHRLFLTAALFLSLSYAAKAQFSLGVSGGTNLTFLKWQVKNVDLNYKPAIGWRVAVHAEYQFSPGFGIRAELADQVFGSLLKVELTDQNGASTGTSARLVESYNSVGGSLAVKFSPLQKQRSLYLLAGPTLAYITHGWQRVSTGRVVEGRDLSKNQRFDLDDKQIIRAQWLADVGLGYTYAFRAKNHLQVEIRYQYGLTQLTRSENVDSGIQTALLTVGYRRDL
jgi:hypothetical protein